VIRRGIKDALKISLLLALLLAGAALVGSLVADAIHWSCT
jgi:hypothetical protein